MPSLSIIARLATRICTCSGCESGPNSLLDGSIASSSVAPPSMRARIAASCSSSISARSTVVIVVAAPSSSFSFAWDSWVSHIGHQCSEKAIHIRSLRLQPFPASSIPPASRIRPTPHGCHPTNSGTIQPRQAPRFFPLTPLPNLPASECLLTSMGISHWAPLSEPFPPFDGTLLPLTRFSERQPPSRGAPIPVTRLSAKAFRLLVAPAVRPTPKQPRIGKMPCVSTPKHPSESKTTRRLDCSPIRCKIADVAKTGCSAAW